MINRLPPSVSTSVLTLIAGFVLSGCSGQSIPGSQLLGGQQQASHITYKLKPLKEITSNVNAQVLWQVDTGTANREVKIHPYVTNGRVYTATGRSVAAWDQQSGKALWKVVVDDTVTGGVNGGDGMVYIGTRGGKALALDADSGAIRWIAPVETEVLAVSESNQGFVVFRTIDGKIHGIKSSNGEIVWQRQQRTPQLSMYGASAPVIVSSGVIAGFDNGKVAAYFLATGKPIWEITLSTAAGSTDLDKITDVDGRLKPLGNALFATNANGRIVGANMNTGKVAWAKAFASYTGADANAKGVYSTNSQGHVFKLAPLSGQSIWKQDDLENRRPTAPTLTASGSHIIVGDQQGNLHWIDTTSGEMAARIAADPAGYSVPVVRSGDTVFALGRSGVLTAIQSQ
ncbi:MAG: outer membrane protein assembly factor BamB [Proteobacteria bacterium]|nr:MAG: outer membrane protein assembly factor BamB [Pseudomonadota bacterium]